LEKELLFLHFLLLGGMNEREGREASDFATILQFNEGKAVREVVAGVVILL
jgi:hypothetical protein